MSLEQNIPTKIPNSAEIDQALKEFEMQSLGQPGQEAGQIPQSSNPEVPRMVGLVMKWSRGAIKEQRTAEYILLGFAIVAIGISLYLFFGGKKKAVPIPSNLQNIDQSQFAE